MIISGQLYIQYGWTNLMSHTSLFVYSNTSVRGVKRKHVLLRFLNINKKELEDLSKQIVFP